MTIVISLWTRTVSDFLHLLLLAPVDLAPELQLVPFVFLSCLIRLCTESKLRLLVGFLDVLRPPISIGSSHRSTPGTYIFALQLGQA
jgi:hypothetical protein